MSKKRLKIFSNEFAKVNEKKKMKFVTKANNWRKSFFF